MRALLEIAHSQYQRITSLRGIQLSTINHLYDLMVAADKYNCVTLLRPWAGSWTVCQNIYANSSLMFRAA
ncbi:hypothetical protein MN608_06553 [Microdochium nivale]|nr:hypothetical protein MN608_06553 [Microdochium nivale]